MPSSSSRPVSPSTTSRRRPDPSGASVRNFGLVWVSGRRSGEELEVARRARRRWEEVGAAVRRGRLPGQRIAHRGGGRHRTSGHGGLRPIARRRRHVPSPSSSPTRSGRPIPPCRETRSPAHCTARTTGWSNRAGPPTRSGPTSNAGRPSATRFHPGRRVVSLGPRSVVDAQGTRWEGDIVVVATGAGLRPSPGDGRTSPRPCAGSGCRCSRRRPFPAR